MPLPKQQTSISQTQPSQKLRDYAVENESSSGSFTLQGGARPPGGLIGARPETCPEVRFHLTSTTWMRLTRIFLLIFFQPGESGGLIDENFDLCTAIDGDQLSNAFGIDLRL